MSVKRKDRWEARHFYRETEKHWFTVTWTGLRWEWEARQFRGGMAAYGSANTEKAAKLAARRWSEKNR